MISERFLGRKKVSDAILLLNLIRLRCGEWLSLEFMMYCVAESVFLIRLVIIACHWSTFSRDCSPGRRLKVQRFIPRRSRWSRHKTDQRIRRVHLSTSMFNQTSVAKQKFINPKWHISFTVHFTIDFLFRHHFCRIFNNIWHVCKYIWHLYWRNKYE